MTTTTSTSTTAAPTPTTLSTTTTLAATTTTVPATTTTSSTTTTTKPAVDVERLARAVLMVGMPLTYVDEAATAHITGGGRAVILFSGNIANEDQLKTLTSDVACAANAPVLIAVDQELGPVRRLGALVTPLPTIEEALDMDPQEVDEAAELLAREMIELGVNMNLAPVIDVVRGDNPVLVDRHLRDDPEVVAGIGAEFIDGLLDEGVAAVAKHFPGHGLSPTDPHNGVTTIQAPLDELLAVDFVPFEAAIEAGVPALMVGHPIYEAIDSDLPASLSPEVARLAREHFGFEGVLVTDSLTMRGVAAERTPGELAVAALSAGMDLLINPDRTQTEPVVRAIVDAVESGDLPLERLIEAAGRVEDLAAAVAPVTCSLS